MTLEMPAIGSTIWAVGDGWIPPTSTGPAPEMISHDSICILNASQKHADIEVYAYFQDRDPAGPFRLGIGAERIHHQRLNDLSDPEAIPRGTDYSLVIRSSAPIVVQHTRLDSRQAENALMSTIAYPLNNA